MRRAIEDYKMINDGDKIAVGVTGGKDSLVLLMGLGRLRDFLPVRFDIEAITIDMGLDNTDFSPIQEICENLRINWTLEKTVIGKIVFDIRKEQNPCSMCANLRRGALNNAAVRLGCNKTALGHNNDDVVETFMLSLLLEGRVHTFSPVTWLDRKQIHVIRPLIYIEEREIKGVINRYGITTVNSQCTVAGKTKRYSIRELLRELTNEYGDVKGRIFGAITRSGIDGWKPAGSRDSRKSCMDLPNKQDKEPSGTN
jgi:tRNA 2-thiocytidine biosynthesis protein TtcA